MIKAAPEIVALGDAGLLLRWPVAPDEDAVAHVQRVAAELAQRAPDWVQDWVPAYCSLAIIFRSDADITLEAARSWLLRTLEEVRAEAVADIGDRRNSEVIQIPVCYDAEFGVDLSALSTHAGKAVEEIVERHTAPVYRVAMLGFSPGFPYLLGLDPTLAMPRKSTPSACIPAGSVAIGGAQAGIYPSDSPGGWQVLGRTPLVLFDPQRDPPSLLHAGDALRFVAISREEFDATKKDPAIQAATEKAAAP